ncbi:biliverdin-producing heme oxygenase [Persicitalea jodogahamensis]|uniref:Biliverdin-producing heme oxygenase n=1 Tax=Persicitalea jodogahamensis TaxID=402147 RepID=A0A8J3G9G0_9BACT|nr:biliverdin-producing heme oxygenase [Persicitalea jodogahamensis]GHB63257.1 biliverdin-producing heme oxygenase [Persicitalea jodogahamensis]
MTPQLPAEPVEVSFASAGFMKRLKAETQSQHQSLEQTEPSRRVMSPALSREGYLEVLYAFHGAFSPLESQVRESLDKNPANLEFVPRSNLAIADIKQLSGSFNPDYFSQGDAIERQGGLSLPEAVGVMYVLEGSKLGGKVISRQLAKTIGVEPQNGGSFFSGGKIEEWKTFQAYCESYAQKRPEAADTIIESAKSTFRWIEGYFLQVSRRNR